MQDRQCFHPVSRIAAQNGHEATSSCTSTPSCNATFVTKAWLARSVSSVLEGAAPNHFALVGAARAFMRARWSGVKFEEELWYLASSKSFVVTPCLAISSKVKLLAIGFSADNCKLILAKAFSVYSDGPHFRAWGAQPICKF